MPYDALGNYIPGDDEPSLDEMQLALTQKPQPSYTQIPTYGYPQAPAPQRPLDTAKQTLQDVATKYNPLMLMKAGREAVGAAFVNPVVGGLQGVATELQQPEFWDASRTKPTGIAERVATDFMQRNAPTTPMAQEFVDTLGKYTQDLPAYLGHLSTNRPVLTPNDVRVMGAEAARLGRQVRDIPTDFANAQAGVQRVDPITGQPTMGTKLQAGAESIGDLMERRRMQGLSPIPGLPETMVPETAMYAVRPAGSRIALPQVPPTKKLGDAPYNIAPYRVLENIVEDPTQPLPPRQVERILDNVRIQGNISNAPYAEWAKNKAMQLYPDAPTPNDALAAWQARFSNSDDLAREQLSWMNEFLASPEGQASSMAQLPSPDEIQARHKAASEWIYGPWLNYVNKHVGTSGDPAVKLASQGLTYSPAAEIREIVADDVTDSAVRALREKGGMPAAGEIAPKLAAKQEELSAAEADLAKWQNRRQAYRDIAMRQGLLDPAELPDYAATSAPIDKLSREVAKLQNEVDNLRLGADYEALSDMAIGIRTQPEALAKLPYSEQQFYPSITRARPEDLIYNLPSTGRLEKTGLGKLADDVYNDVMSGKIPKEQLPKLSIEKLIREKAVPRIAEEKKAKALQRAYIAQATEVMKNTMESNVGSADYFGNVGVIELSRESGLNAAQLTKILSEATEVLDHCIAEGGRAGTGQPNPWQTGRKRTRSPIYNVATGQKDPSSARDISAYASNIINNGDIMADIRDRNTGLPIATLELSRSHVDADGVTKYYVGWASGPSNGPVDSKYRDSIKEYLNSRADIIHSPGDNIKKNIGLYDTASSTGGELGAIAGVSGQQVRNINFSGLPRFATREDIKAYIDGIKQAQQVAQTQAPEAPGFNATQVMRDVESAIDNALADLTTATEDDRNFVNQVIRDRLSTARIAGLSDPAAVSAYITEQANLLREWSDFSMMSNSQRRQDAADAIYDFLPDLEGIAAAIGRGHYTPTPTAAPTPQVEAAPVNTAGTFNNFINSVRRDVGADIADRVETIAIRVASNLTPGGSVAMAMRNRPAQFAQALREAGTREDSQLVDFTLSELADMVSIPEPAQQAPTTLAPFTTQDFSDFIQLVNTNLGFTEADRFVRVANRIAAYMGGGTIGQALELNPTTFADSLASAARDPENAAISRALSDVADRIAPPIRDLNEPLPELNFEPDPTHPANQLDVTQATDGQLVRNMAPGRFTEVNRMIDMALADARAVGVGSEEAYDTLRRGGVANIQGTPYELEYIARNVRSGLEITERARQNREQPRINIDDMAFELFNDTRQGDDPNSPRNLEELRTTLQALETGNFDDMRIRALPADQRDQAQRSIAHAIREIMDDVGVTLPAEPQQQQLATYDPIPDDVGDMPIGELRNLLTPGELGDVASVAEDILRFNTDPGELQTIASLVHDNRMSTWEAFNPGQRAMLAMRLHSAASELLRNQAPELPIDALGAANEALAQFESAIDTDDAYGADRELARAVLELQEGEDEIYGLWHEPERMTPALRIYLIQQLERLRRDLGGEAPEGRANGGLIRGYQAGGKVEYPPFYRASDQAIERSEDMYGAHKQDDAGDAARHMLASGYMAQSLGPTVAKGLGWLHEFKEAPIRTAGHALGLSNPRYDYEMDMHNNALGIEMAQKAKNRTDFEQMVKDSIAKGTTATTPGRVRLMTPEQAEVGRGKLKYANGGTVSQTPSLDAMKYELLMRSK